MRFKVILAIAFVSRITTALTSSFVAYTAVSVAIELRVQVMPTRTKFIFHYLFLLNLTPVGAFATPVRLRLLTGIPTFVINALLSRHRVIFV